MGFSQALVCFLPPHTDQHEPHSPAEGQNWLCYHIHECPFPLSSKERGKKTP